MAINNFKPSTKELFYVPLTPEKEEQDVSKLRKLSNSEVRKLMDKVTVKSITSKKKVVKQAK